MKYLEKIIAMLNKAGYVKSSRGNLGGYKLTKEPEEYKIGDILRTAEGDLAPTLCVQGICDRKDKCLTFDFWKGLDEAIEKYTSSPLLLNIVTGIGVSVISILVPLSFSFIISLLVVTMSTKFSL